MERRKAIALLMAIAVVLCGHGAAQTIDAPVAEPPRAAELDALTEHATRLLQQRYGYCITYRSPFSRRQRWLSW